MRRIRYSVAMSLDGYIADADGAYGWIPMDPDIDFSARLAKIDTLIMGRGTFEIIRAAPDGNPWLESMDRYVVSTTLDPADCTDVTVVSSDVESFVSDLKARDGKDIWLFGGGVLFRSLLEAHLVDRIEVGIVPVLLGEGIKLLPGLEGLAELELHSVEEFAQSGIVLVKYDVVGPSVLQDS